MSYFGTIGPKPGLNQSQPSVTGSRPVVGQIAGRVLLEDGPLSDIDPTDHALATIASILEHPESSREAEKTATVEEHRALNIRTRRVLRSSANRAANAAGLLLSS